MIFLLTYWRFILLGLAILAVVGYIARCEYVKKDYAQFIIRLEEQVAAQKREIEAQQERDRKAKEKADADYSRRIVALNATVKRLRDAQANTVFVPKAPAPAGSPDIATFNRGELERALRDFTGEVQSLIAEGDAAEAGLNAARGWAQR